MSGTYLPSVAVSMRVLGERIGLGSKGRREPELEAFTKPKTRTLNVWMWNRLLEQRKGEISNSNNGCRAAFETRHYRRTIDFKRHVKPEPAAALSKACKLKFEG